jgi:hypothetical protein
MNYATLLAQSDNLPLWVDELLQPHRLALMVPIVAIVGGLTYATIIAMIRHRERMAKLEHGIDPDAQDSQR